MVFSKKLIFVFDSDNPQDYELSKNEKISLVCNKNDFKDFFKVHWNIYKDDKYWVPPFWNDTRNYFKRKNPFWDHSDVKIFVAYRNNVPIGRIGAIIDHNLPKENGKKIGYFGFFECINDTEIACNLLKIAEQTLDSWDINIMRGPINGRIDQYSGFLMKGFDSIPYLLGVYSPRYYLDLVSKYGLRKSKDLISYQIDLTKPIPKEVEEVTRSCEEKGIKIRPFNRLHFNRDLQIWFDLMLDVFSDHYGYTPSSYEELKWTFGIRQLRYIINPKLFLFAECEGETIGFRWSLPDFNPIFKKINSKFGLIGSLKFLWYSRNVQRGRFIVMGIKKEYRGRNIGTCFNYYTMLEMKRKGYISAEYGWIEEDNIASHRSGEKIGGLPYKKYRVYEKDIKI